LALARRPRVSEQVRPAQLRLEQAQVRPPPKVEPPWPLERGLPRASGPLRRHRWLRVRLRRPRRGPGRELYRPRRARRAAAA